MDTTTTPKAPRLTANEEARAALAETGEKITPEEESSLAMILAKAKTTDPATEMAVISPAMAARLFREHNSYNRDFDVQWANELARRMKAGLWKYNNQSIGFFSDATVGDGQHRLAAAALADFTLSVAISRGMDRSTISTIDTGRRRDASQEAKLNGILSAKRKQAIVKTEAGYRTKLGDVTASLRSESEISAAIKANDATLDIAITIARDSRQNITYPVLSQSQAEPLVYLLLRSGWPQQRIQEQLSLFQTGISESETTAFFQAAELIRRSHEGRARQDKLSRQKEIALAVVALLETEKGHNAVPKKLLKNAARSNRLPDPKYIDPAPQTSQAA